MSLITESIEKKVSRTLLKAGAMVRSAYEDIHQSRRRLVVGQREHVLEPRTDRDNNRLLTTGEENQLREATSYKPQSRSYRSYPPDTGAKGKGKGKGTGRARTNQM